MAEEILINVASHETRAALVVQGIVQEIHIEREATRGLVGNIYLGKVARVLPGMQSAFIDIGLERAAFLHIADVWQHRSGQSVLPLEKLMFDGQSLLVQVIKDPIGTKGARLSTQISIAGRFLVYLPQDPHIGVSQRIGDEKERTALREQVQALLPPGEKGGFIIRTMAEDALPSELAADVAYLIRRWRQILELTQTSPAPSLLYQELSLSQRILRDMVREETDLVLVDSEATLKDLQVFSASYMPALAHRLTLYKAERPLFDLHRIDEEIQRALSRRVDLKSGGYLIIDQTEAMTTIDINTGGYVGGRNFDDTIFKTNLEAAHTIARQLRLRNLGGIIIIDFIDMQSAEHRHNVLSELKRSLHQERTRTSVSEFSTLGLVEMTRKRTRESLAHVMCEPCPACEGKGQVKTARTVCFEIMREIARESVQFNPREFKVVASANVIEMFLDEESQHLAQLGDEVGKPISLHSETSYQQENYDIVLL
jgi:ribonuclease G